MHRGLNVFCSSVAESLKEILIYWFTTLALIHHSLMLLSWIIQLSQTTPLSIYLIDCLSYFLCTICNIIFTFNIMWIALNAAAMVIQSHKQNSPFFPDFKLLINSSWTVSLSHYFKNSINLNTISLLSNFALNKLYTRQNIL
jgi:hypothetical protein